MGIKAAKSPEMIEELENPFRRPESRMASEADLSRFRLEAEISWLKSETALRERRALDCNCFP